MSDQGQWFKLWVGSDDDPDLGNLSNEDFGRWCKLGIYVKKHGVEGTINIKPPAKILQNKFAVSSFENVVSVLKKFPNLKINGDANSSVSDETNLTVTLLNWLKYQGDYSTHRVRKFREMKRSKRRGEEKRKEEKRKEEKEEKKNNILPSEIPSAFSISESIKKWAKNKNLPNPETEIEAFIDHHKSRGSLMKDWDAAFRTWIRNSVKFGKIGGRPQKSQADHNTPVGERVVL